MLEQVSVLAAESKGRLQPWHSKHGSSGYELALLDVGPPKTAEVGQARIELEPSTAPRARLALYSNHLLLREPALD